MIHFLDDGMNRAAALTGSYDTTLVLLSFLIAILASFAGLLICDRVGAASTQVKRFIWLTVGSLVMGFGVWSMHFIGMLAFVLPVAITYDATVTLLSVVPAVLASSFALHIIAGQNRGHGLYILSGVLLGLGIGSMHYTGMTGMEGLVEMRYDPVLFVLSIGIAVLLGIAAVYAHILGSRLFGGHRLISKSILAATFMGFAIAGMHYTAMAATKFFPLSSGEHSGHVSASAHLSWLAIGVSAIALLIVITAVAAIFFARQLQASSQMLTSTRQRLIEASDAIEAMNDGFLLFDEQDCVLMCNQAYADITGYAVDTVIGATPTLLKRLRGNEVLSRELQEQLAHKGVWQGEIRDRRANGEDYPGWLKISAVRPREGVSLHFVATLTDISERKANEEKALATQEALRESEAQFRQIANGMPQLAWVTRSDGRHEWFNSRWYEYTGADPSRFEFNRWVEHVHPHDRSHAVGAWQRSLASGEPYQVEFRCQRYDGEWRWFLAAAVPLRGADGEVTRWFGTFTDIHDQKEAEAALRRMNHELEEFAYVSSHDLQEPLRKVSLYTQLLLEDIRSGETANNLQYGEFVRTGVQRMQTLIQDLLIYSRTIHHSPEQDTMRADLNRSLADAIDGFEQPPNQVGTFICTDSLPVVRADQMQMSLVFQNLLSNALKYQPKGQRPRIQISVQQRGDEWMISVRDNGIGFAPEYEQKIFGLFKRLYKHEYAGTGLGLAICKRIIERYQGKIWATSAGEGMGAAFHFTLPAVAAADQPESHAQENSGDGQ